MGWPVEYRESAKDDLAGAAAWYDEHHGIGAGHRLAVAVLDVVSRIAERHLAFPTWLEDPRYRRALVPHYPYLVIFTVNAAASSIIIEAVAHMSREPAYWRERP